MKLEVNTQPSNKLKWSECQIGEVYEVDGGGYYMKVFDNQCLILSSNERLMGRKANISENDNTRVWTHIPHAKIVV